MNTSITQYIQTPNNLLALLSRYRVVIPGIQRHYVQGADTSKALSIRKQFVNEIFASIEKEEPLHLHFIYGPIDTDGEDSFVPVDGQQRLTTLWLIGRYAAELLEPVIRFDILKLLSRFSYADRINATRFCHTLTLPETHWNIKEDACSTILGQAWFLDYWKEDETVASMLRMLSSIHSLWQEFAFSGEQVLNALGSLIQFELKIDSFGDDIYMKMNARGLQLTQWENFKSKFAEHLGEYKEVWDRSIEEHANSFFEKSEARHELPDSSFFALFARIMALEKGKLCSKNIKTLATLVDTTWEHIELPFVPFSDFTDVLGSDSTSATAIAKRYTVMIKTALECYQAAVPYFDDKPLFDTLFHPQNNNDLDFTLCCYEYFKAFGEVKNEDFLQATRLIWNILENVSPQDGNPLNRISIIKKFISLNSPTLYSQEAFNVFSANDAGQVVEEAEKSVKFYDDDQTSPNDWDENTMGKWIDWRHAIEYAEKQAFFNGSIRFLYRNSEGKATWDNFVTKLLHCMELFTKDGLCDEHKAKANQALIAYCDSWESIRRTPVFGRKKDCWKRVLLKDSLTKYVNSFLLEPFTIIENNDPILSILTNNNVWDNIIQNNETYELEWKADSPSLWLNRYLSWTLKLRRNNREDVLDAFIGNPNIHFRQKESQRFLYVNGQNYYYAVPIFFDYDYHGKTYRFAWQTWGWIDMYDKYNKLYDLYYKKFNMGFNVQINKEKDTNGEFIIKTDEFIKNIEDCIDEYEDFLIQLKTE